MGQDVHPRQAKAWLLVLLLLGQEAQAAAKGFGANASAEELRPVFAQPNAAVALAGRRLQVALGADWQWPVTSSMRFVTVTQGGEDVPTEGTDMVQVVSSLNYNEIIISTNDVATPIGAEHTAPAVKLVQGVADRTRCQGNTFDMPVGVAIPDSGDPIAGEMGITNGALLLTNSGNTLSKNQVNIIFMHGGQYKLCYTPDGTFGGNDGSEVNNNIVLTMIQVFGISSNCRGSDGCLRDERWECWFGYKGESVQNCEFNFQYDGGRVGWGIEVGQRSRITWTPPYGADTVDPGGAVLYNPQACASAAPDQTMFDVPTGVSVYMDVSTQSTATMPAVQSTHSSAFTTAACYCPNYNAERGAHCTNADAAQCCDSFAEFIQQFGVIYFWTIRICDYDHYTTCTPNPPTSYRYMRVLPQQKFTLRIDCPPGGGCFATDENRVKFIGQVASNDRPSWDANAGCRTYLQENFAAVWPSTTDSRALSGGNSRDYKAWRSKQVKLNLSLKRAIDVCYSNADSGNPNSWFKVGSIQTSDAFAFASQSIASGQVSAPIPTIKYVGHPGSVTLYGGMMGAGTLPSPFESNMYSGKALLNILSFDRELQYGVGAAQKTLMEHYSYDQARPLDFQTQMDRECQKENYSPTLVTGPSSKQAAKTYIANPDINSANTITQYMSFSGPDRDQDMTVKLAGVVAVCYCGMVSAQDECESSSFWLYAGLMTIQGPEGGRSFIFPTNVVVKFDLKGWGFSQDDRLRIIPATSQCSANNNDPDSDLGFKVGCPAVDGTGCRQATAQESIMTSVMTSTSVGIYIDRVDIQQSSSVLRFTADISQHLGSDPDFGYDIITLNLDRIMVNSNDINTVTAIERFEANKLAGVYEFQDTFNPGPIQTFQVGHRVVQLPDAQQMMIPQGWVSTDEFPFTVVPFSFVDQQGHWIRRNKLETNEEIKGTTAASNLKLCWGIKSEGLNKFYHEAGTVNFEDPPPMVSAVVSLTTKMQEAVAPVVIAFKTTASRSEYSTPTGQTMLMLRFLDVSTKLEPYYFAQEQGLRGVYRVPPYQEVTQAQQRQHVCGKIFLEFWSNHPEGFPMPVGCHYTQKLSDVPAQGSSNFFREFYITFGEGNGLRQDVEYHIVLNAKIMSFTSGEPLVDIYAMCAGFTGCARPYQVFEIGSAVVSRGTMVPATMADPQFASDGFLIQRSNPLDGVLNLSNLNILQIRLRGEAALRGIVKESLIRMYMWPLTAWNVGTGSCSAECIPFHFNTKRCSGLVGCGSEEVVAGSGRRNIVKITLPTEMDTIDQTTTHTIKISGLTLPVQGFFPTNFGVQLTKPDDTAPFYIHATGMIMKVPDAGSTTGRIVISDRSGYGPMPFRSDVGNVLYFRLKLGATLWNVGRSNAAFLTIGLPNGYGACSVAGAGAPARDLKVFLQKTGGYVDNNRGVLAVSTDDGDWANSNIKTCTYELHANNQAIYAGMVFYVAVTVVNPVNPLPKTDPENQLTIKLSSLGAYDPEGIAEPAPYDMPEVPFISLAEEKSLGQDYWAGNPAIINTLSEELVQPSSFARSCCGPNYDTRRSEDFLRIFFFTSTYIGQNGYVVFDAPSGFDFGASCTSRDLAERYYAFVGQFESRLYRLKNMGSCVGKRYPTTETTYNRARLQVGGIIDAPLYYGFELRVLYPTTYDTTQHENWFLWLLDSNAYVLEGSQTTMRFNKFKDPAQTSFFDKSWGMYEEIGPTIPVQVLSDGAAAPRPTSLTNVNTEVVFYPITFAVDIDTSLRISAPVGFKWDVDPNSFFRRTNGTLEDWPQLPSVQNQNQLVWSTLSLKGSTLYGFRATVEVPNFNPVNSANAFFIEFGYRNSNIQKRLFANVVEAPSIAALINAEVYASTNLVNYVDNRIEFAVQTVTTLTPSTGIVVKGSDVTTGFSFQCPQTVMALPESSPFPTDLICVYQVASDGAPQITLKVNKISMPPGYYRWEMTAQNPPTRKQDPGLWTFGTYLAASDYPTTAILDKELQATGFKIDNMMREAKMTALDQVQRAATIRNDRPGKPNQLIFQFSLNIRPLANRILTLRGPRGFVFDDNCLPEVITDRNDVFGPNTQDVWPPDYSEWPPEYRPTKCLGNGREAQITVPSGLGRYSLYVFRIGVRSNPHSTPDWNKWSINFNDESSDPFQGFTVWTFTNLNIGAVGAMKSPTGAGVMRTATPVTIVFTPYNSVPAKPPNEDFGGMMRLTVPVGYEIRHNNLACEVELFVSDGSVIFESADYSCMVENTVKQLLYMAGEKDVRGSYSYTLIVWVFNPPTSTLADTWRIDTFHRFSAEPDTALDETEFLGYNVNNQLNIFQVANTNQVLNGNTKVNDIDILMQFPDPLKDGDVVMVTGPRGFNLIGNPELANCNEFRWVGDVQLRATGEPGCTCDLQGFCSIMWTIDESKDPAYPQNENLHFKVATTNPSKTPFLTDNYWKAAHMKADVVKSSHIFQGWSVNPQLENVDISLVGTKYAAGKISDIEIKFTPITDAETIRIEAIFPSQFNFDQSTVALPYDIDGQSEGSTLIINRGGFRAGVMTTIRINTVRLGRAGGQTRFNLVTFKDETLMDKRDEKLDFSGGFRLPGMITVINAPLLKSQYQDAKATFPVKSLFQPRILEDAKAEFTLSFSRPVQASERLLVTCQGQAKYQLKQSPFVVIGIGPIETSVEIDPDADQPAWGKA
ncbi:unnamed protein product [Effrenium voratum]|uniref:Protein arginine methyltransferase 10 n=1 Tax=Effrenium voratum TaxID=2562239 RepID=A0AA36HW59_9DINO|nr:unnamed protein product [Effrenium voratum]CAJ1431993.1 unnamed protein product [Effrenium voratum]